MHGMRKVMQAFVGATSCDGKNGSITRHYTIGGRPDVSIVACFVRQAWREQAQPQHSDQCS